MKSRFPHSLLATGIISHGDTAAFLRFRHKLQAGTPIVYAAIGGSITGGGCATTPANFYVSRLGNAIAERTSCHVINAGIGATGSGYGVFRADTDILSHSPDLITIEFAVNDCDKMEPEATFEALIRKCLRLAPTALILLIFTVYRNGRSMEPTQTIIGNHYHLAMLSYKQILSRGIADHLFQWEDVAADHVHPNDNGHGLLAEAAAYFLLESSIPDSSSDSPVAITLPKCLYSGTSDYEKGKIIRARDFSPTNNLGWQLNQGADVDICYCADEPGSILELDLTGKRLWLGFRQYAGNYGRIKVRVDDRDPLILEGYFTRFAENDAWRGGHLTYEEIFIDTQTRQHHIRIELLPDHHPDSRGNHFEIAYVMSCT